MYRLTDINNMKTQIKQGQKVLVDNTIRTIYDIYNDNKVSLCLIDADGYEYEDVEEDFLTNIDNIKTI